MSDDEIDAPDMAVSRAEWRDDRRTAGPDRLVREEPLEIRIGGVPIAVVMRTPGHDDELVRGFLRTEGIVISGDQVRTIRYCTDVDEPDAEHNVIQVVLRDDVEVDLPRLRRNMFTTSSCGVCGKASLEQALTVSGPIEDAGSFPLASLYD